MELTGQIKTGVSIFEKLDGIVRNVYSMRKEMTFVKEKKANYLNGKYYPGVHKDGLAGICNLRYINERLPIDITYNRLNNIPLSLILTDIDFFKKIKDKYGDASSGKILVDYSNLILKSIRSNVDWVGKIGKGKFLIVLNGTDLKSAFYVAEKIRKKLESTAFKYNENSINITSSFGLYSVIEYKSEVTVSELISKVDNNLHHAKIRGRNRTFSCQGVFDQVNCDKENKDIKLSELEKQINELRETLNEICCTDDRSGTNLDRLITSQCLDKLIVKYMKTTGNV